VRKLLSIVLVMFIVITVFGVSTSRDGIRINPAIAMEQRTEDAKIQKPAAPVFPQIAPNDPAYKWQWNLDDWGKAYVSGSGKTKVTVYSNYGIQAQKVWKLGYSGNGVKIAFLSYGIAYEDYTDPTGKVYKKALDFKNTKFDTTNARNFAIVDRTSELFKHANDTAGYGTHMAGTIAASTNDSFGCAGIAYNATLLPINTFPIQPGNFVLPEGIDWAVSCGAKVIFISNWTIGDSDPMHEAIIRAHDAGVVVVSSSQLNNPNYPDANYPAAYDEVISVGATRFDGTYTAYSAYGTWLDLVAPGGDISLDQNKDNASDGIIQLSFLNTDPTYFFFRTLNFHGTPGATVAGIVALMLEKNPNLTPDEVREILINTAKHDKSGVTYPDQHYGYGSVDAYGALVNTPTP
jgi:serine protease